MLLWLPAHRWISRSVVYPAASSNRPFQLVGVPLRLSRTLLSIAGCVGFCFQAGGELVAVEPNNAPRVAEVVIQGADQLHADRVLARLGTRQGDFLDRAVMADDVRAIYDMRAFTGIRTEVEPLPNGQVKVIYVVTELPYVGEVSFSGLGYFKRRSMRKEVRTKRGRYLDPLILERDRKHLETILREDNYLRASVKVATTVNEEDGIASVEFQVDLGETVEVAKVQFEGLPEGVVGFFLKQRLANRPGTSFDADMVKWDQGTVAQYLADQGYLDAEVTRVREEFFDAVESWEDRYRHGPQIVPEGEKNNRVVLTYFIKPGKRYYLRSVRFVHDPDIASEQELREAFGLADGEPFRNRDIQRSVERARRVVANEGHARARIAQDMIIDPGSDQVDLTLRLTEGSIYRIGRVDPDGNTVTRDNIIRRAMRLQPGDLYNQDAVDRSRLQLVRTGIFLNAPPRPVTIDTLYDPARPEEADLRVRVAEDDTGAFNFSIGWSSVSGIVGEVAYEERNFDFVGAILEQEHWRGGNQTLGAALSWSQDETSFRTYFTNPSVFDSDYFLSLNFRIADDSSFHWDEKRLSVGGSVGRFFLDRDLLLSAGYTFTTLSTSDFDVEAANDAILNAGESFVDHALTLEQRYDLRDNPAFPTSGYLFALEQTMHGNWGPDSDNPYVEFAATANAYLPLFESELGGVTFLEFRNRAIFAEPIGNNTEVPFYGRYRGGGPYPRHRGFDSQEQGPIRPNILGVDSEAGGTREVLSTVQLSIPLQGTNRGLRAVAFADYGHVWDQYKAEDDLERLDEIKAAAKREFPTLSDQIDANDGSSFKDSESLTLSDFSLAIGTGLRFPAFLPVSLDFAYVIDPKPNQSRTVFHFSISGGF